MQKNTKYYCFVGILNWLTIVKRRQYDVLSNTSTVDLVLPILILSRGVFCSNFVMVPTIACKRNSMLGTLYIMQLHNSHSSLDQLSKCKA